MLAGCRVRAELHGDEGADAEAAAEEVEEVKAERKPMDWKKCKESLVPLRKGFKQAWGFVTRVAKRADTDSEGNCRRRPPLQDIETQLNAQIENSRILEATVQAQLGSRVLRLVAVGGAARRE